ncbi:MULTISPECIES: hydroxyacylglutathione hydrolase [Mannheimia]|uniref:Hydroxyacylglutathione hydrolase n=1 Tax=Mannheimia pernigra TaxID=111844 RepID=A0A7D5DWZ5_9PAST|nr:MULTISPECIES: hydroxyacylglutathione hydrolase [Mannheimia]QLB40546.1 hydroxyacylglutathione hydrolase [Mannheimia pernigra]QTM00225.1 hydroxyacylglutathione hydrolase [Mannheimia sp. ZY171111]
MLQITPIPALSDNYIWAIRQAQDVIIVDPSEHQPVLDFIANNSLNLTAILLTHNHNDHTDGVAGIVEKYPNIPIYGPQEATEFANMIVSPEQHIKLFGYEVQIIESAGHTAGHISYLFGYDYLFCGDALFSGGCGRVFTGDYQAQFDALQRFKNLPDSVKAYPAHEYTKSNLKFAEAVLPTSCTLAEYQEQVDILRSQNKPTLPTTIRLEMQVNPFMQAVDLQEFIALRKKKDNF